MKILICLIIALTLSGCGFTPMLATDESESDQTGGARLLVNTQKGSNGYLCDQLRKRLKRNLNNLELDSKYKIIVTLNESSGSIAYAADATASRSMERLSANIIINKDGNLVHSTTVNTITSYSQNANDEFMNQSAQTGAKERLLESLVLDITREIHHFAKTYKE